MPADGISVVSLDASDAQLVDSSSGDVLLYNSSATVTVQLSTASTFPPASTFPLGPGKQLVWPAGRALYGKATAVGATVFVLPGGSAIPPSAAELAAAQAAGFSIVDYETAELSGDPSTSLRFPGVPAGQMWQVTRATVANNGAAACQVRLYVVTVGAALTQADIRSGTNNGQFDEADYPDLGLWVLGGQQLVAQWVNATAGSTSSISVQYRLLAQAT